MLEERIRDDEVRLKQSITACNYLIKAWKKIQALKKLHYHIILTLLYLNKSI